MTFTVFSSRRSLMLPLAGLGLALLAGTALFAHGSPSGRADAGATALAGVSAAASSATAVVPTAPGASDGLAPELFPHAATVANSVVASPAVSTLSPFEVADQESLVRLPVNARHMLVMDDAGHVLMAKDAQAVVPIASLTKLMTAMVILDARQAREEELRVEDADVDRLKHSASRLAVGARLTRETALDMALMASENRAASVLARHYPGGLAAFEAAMRAKIRALGLTHTVLEDPTGLSPGNVSTAAEVARIALAASRYPDITRITSLKAAKVPVNGRPRDLHNTNHLVGGKGWDIGLSKTGYTTEAGRCLVMRMKQGDRTLTVVLLDTDGSAQRLRDASLIRRSLGGEPPAAELHRGRKHHKLPLS